MKLTATIKNFKKNIVGYFNNKNGTSDDMLKVIERIVNKSIYQFVKESSEFENSNIFPEDSICFIKSTTNYSKTILIDENITKPFKFIAVGKGSLSINSLGTNKTLSKNELYTFTPVTPYESGDYTVFGKLTYLEGNSASEIEVSYQTRFN